MEKKKKKEDLTEMENLLEEVRPGQGLETILEQINLFKRAWEDHTNGELEQLTRLKDPKSERVKNFETHYRMHYRTVQGQ